MTIPVQRTNLFKPATLEDRRRQIDAYLRSMLRPLDRLDTDIADLADVIYLTSELVDEDSDEAAALDDLKAVLEDVEHQLDQIAEVFRTEFEARQDAYLRNAALPVGAPGAWIREALAEQGR